MTSLVVRTIPWEFEGDVPFLWQPDNANFTLFCGCDMKAFAGALSSAER